MAAQTVPVESARNSASEYAAFRKKAVGKKASASVAALAARVSYRLSAMRYRKKSAKGVAASEIRTPQNAGPPPRSIPALTSVGYSGKKAVEAGASSPYPPVAISEYQAPSQWAQ